MKNTTLTMSFNTERLDALTYHMGKKEADLQEELKDYLQKLYEKYVPQATREYLVLERAGHTVSAQFRCWCLSFLFSEGYKRPDLLCNLCPLLEKRSGRKNYLLLSKSVSIF